MPILSPYVNQKILFFLKLDSWIFDFFTQVNFHFIIYFFCVNCIALLKKNFFPKLVGDFFFNQVNFYSITFFFMSMSSPYLNQKPLFPPKKLIELIFLNKSIFI